MAVVPRDKALRSDQILRLLQACHDNGMRIRGVRHEVTGAGVRQQGGGLHHSRGKNGQLVRKKVITPAWLAVKLAPLSI
jgi:hypothetical protein